MILNSTLNSQTLERSRNRNEGVGRDSGTELLPPCSS